MFDRKIKNKRMGTKSKGILAVFLASCIVLTGIPFGSLEVQAEGAATVTNIYAKFSETWEPSEFEVATAGNQTSGKVLFAKFVQGGSYTASGLETDLPLYINNATVKGYTGSLEEIRLSGNSSLNMGTYTISSTEVQFPAYTGEVTTAEIGALFNFYNSETYTGSNAKPYSYTYTADTTQTGLINMDTLTVNSGKKLTIVNGEDYSGAIVTKNAVIDGSVVIAGNDIRDSNRLVIDVNGSLTVANGGSITGSGNACLEICTGATVTGITLYDHYDEENSQWIPFVCDGNQNREEFSYDTEALRWVRNQGGGEPGGLPTNTYRIVKIGDEACNLTVNGTPSEFGDNTQRNFEAEETINFAITGTVYKVIVISSDSEGELQGTAGSYRYTPSTDSGFEILVYTTQEAYNYDRCQPGEGEFAVEYEMRHRDENEFSDQNTVTCNIVKQATYNGRTRLVVANEVSEVSLTINATEGYDYEVTMHRSSANDDVTEDAKNNGNVLRWDVTAKENSDRPEICFYRSTGGGEDPNPGDPNPGGGDTQDLKSYIESQQFAFGDWDENGSVDGDDIKLGMAYQIYYPKLKDNPALREEYGIATYSDLISLISVVSADPSENLTAKDATGTNRTIPAYSYTVALTKGSGVTAENITAAGTAYAFAFTDGSKYQKNSRGCILAVTEKGNEKSYFLRCANAYTSDTKPDTTPMVVGGNENEASIVVVSDFDVIYDEQKKTYNRKVSIFGNGAKLDHLLSQEEDKDVVAYQGRNEDFMRAIEKIDDPDWGCIFSVFTFCQESFEGVQVQGSGASGNTPSWAFNQYPIFSTDDTDATEKEAVVYFGNPNVTIKPVNNLTGLDDTVTGIASVELADSNISSAAVGIVRQSDTEWKVNFNSDFYDLVKVKIVYTLQGGGTKTSYLNIHRVGIDILSGHGSDGMTLFHGTENGPTYDAAGNELVIWGTYYYPQATSTDLVDLYVTYTWPGGSTTKKTIRNNPSLNMAYDHGGRGNCQSSDFILYEGTNAGAPTKIEAIAVVSGFDNTSATSFSGAKFGAGKGVVWNNYLGNN